MRPDLPSRSNGILSSTASTTSTLRQPICGCRGRNNLGRFNLVATVTFDRQAYKKTLLKSPAPVIRLQIGQSFVEPKHRSQQSLQQVCQHPVDTVGSVYGEMQIRHRDAVAVWDCCGRIAFITLASHTDGGDALENPICSREER